jgi:hypothetical protein
LGGTIITAAENLALTPGALLATEAIRQCSWNDSLWLTIPIQETQWFEALALGMRLWARYKAVRKKTKGVYEILDLSFHDDKTTNPKDVHVVLPLWMPQ